MANTDEGVWQEGGRLSVAERIVGLRVCEEQQSRGFHDGDRVGSQPRA